MYCRICGDENSALYRPTRRLTLCDSCAKDTPPKRSRRMFDLAYWGPDYHEVNARIRSEFYSDYLASSLDFESYRRATTEAA